MRSLFCDFLYTPTGHHDQDFTIFNAYCDRQLTHIKENEKKFLKNILKISKILKRDENKTIGTVSFICLYIASIITNRWDYNLVIHFMPSNRPHLYKYLISKFITKCNKIIVFSDCVKKDLLEKTKTKNDKKIYEIHTREIKHVSKILNEKPVILTIGSLNETKKIEDLLRVIGKQKFSNLSFRFICNGINKRLEAMKFSNNCGNDIYISDSFPSLDNYKEELYKADYSYLAYTNSYGVRFSGIFFDSLAQGTPVIVNENKSFQIMVEKYKCGFVFHSEEELMQILRGLDEKTLQHPTISKELLEFYSPENNKTLAQLLLK